MSTIRSSEAPGPGISGTRPVNIRKITGARPLRAASSALPQVGHLSPATVCFSLDHESALGKTQALQHAATRRIRKASGFLIHPAGRLVKSDLGQAYRGDGEARPCFGKTPRLLTCFRRNPLRRVAGADLWQTASRPVRWQPESLSAQVAVFSTDRRSTFIYERPSTEPSGAGRSPFANSPGHWRLAGRTYRSRSARPPVAVAAPSAWRT